MIKIPTKNGYIRYLVRPVKKVVYVFPEQMEVRRHGSMLSAKKRLCFKNSLPFTANTFECFLPTNLKHRFCTNRNCYTLTI